MEATATVGKTMWTMGAQLLALSVLLIIVFALVWAGSKGWKKGQESGYNVANSADGYSF